MKAKKQMRYGVRKGKRTYFPGRLRGKQRKKPAWKLALLEAARREKEQAGRSGKTPGDAGIGGTGKAKGRRPSAKKPTVSTATATVRRKEARSGKGWRKYAAPKATLKYLEMFTRIANRAKAQKIRRNGSEK